MTKNSQKTVGVIGLGNMGAGIATNLANAGHNVLGWDLNPKAIKKLGGLTVPSKPEEMSAKCAVIFLVVPGSKEIQQLFKGKFGILENAKRGLVLYDLTTSDPSFTKKLANQANATNVEYLDAGMTGGAPGADQGTLKLMIGGNKKVFNRTRHILKTFTSELYHLGDIGSGHTMKIIFNMVVHTNFLVICEAALIAEKSGISLKNVIDIVNAGNARNYASERRFPDHILSGTWDARSRIYNLNKDVGMAVELAKKMGLTANIGKSTHKYLKLAVKNGMSEDDFSLLYKEFRNLIQ